jgi:type III secretion system-like peptide-binding chaperone
MSSSPEEVAAQFDTARKLVEEVVIRLGLDPAKVRGESGPDLINWSIQRGSAVILVSVAKNDRGDAASLSAVSPIMSLPPEPDLLPFFRRLLELNGHGLINAAFGLVGDRVVVKSERPTAFLDAAEVEQIILHLSAVADTYDDRLVKEFGGHRASDLATT